MTTEWIELKTLQDVAKADAAEWEIELRDTYNRWVRWRGIGWSISGEYRGRPRQPKMKTVKMLAYLLSGQLVWFQDDTGCPDGNRFWIRIPAHDIKIEIPEAQ